MTASAPGLEYCDDPQLLIPGSIGALNEDAGLARERAADLRSAAEELARRDVTSWVGLGSYNWRTRRTAAARALEGAADVYEVLSGVLMAHARVMAWARGRARVAVRLWAEAKAMDALISTAPAAPSSRGGVPIQTGDARYPTMAGTGGDFARAAIAILEAARDEVSWSAEAAARFMGQVSDGMPDGRFHGDQFIQGIGDWLVGLARFHGMRLLIDPIGYLNDVRDVGTGVLDTADYLLANPHEAGAVLLDLQQLHDNPGRWWGAMFPDIALSVVGAGAGLAGRGGSAATRAASILDDVAGSGRDVVRVRGFTLEELARTSAGDGPVVFRARPDLTTTELETLMDHVNYSNAARLDGYLSETGRVSTTGDLRGDANLAAAVERARAADAGTPYQGQVGHAPDTTWTGKAEAYAWLDQSQRLNASLGGTAPHYPIGYRPTIFQVEDLNGSRWPSPVPGESQ